MVILSTIVLLCSIKVGFDYWRIEVKKIGVNHPVEWLILTAAFCALDWMFHLKYTALGVQCIGSWIYFDALLNVVRKRPVFYVGKTAGLDVFFNGFNHPETTMILTKIVLLFITTYLYIIV